MPPTSSKTGSKRGRSRDPVRTRAAILAAAREVFVDHGFTGARTSEIAKSADVPQGLIYHYFSGKEELFDCVLEDVFAPYFDGMLAMLSSAEEPDLELLERSVRVYFEFLGENPDVPRLMAWWLADQGWLEKPLARKKNMAEQVEALGAQRIQQGQEAGLIRDDLDPRLVIKTFIDLCMMWHMSKGADMMQCHAPDGGDAPEAMDRAYLDHMIEVFMRGIAAPAARG